MLSPGSGASADRQNGFHGGRGRWSTGISRRDALVAGGSATAGLVGGGLLVAGAAALRRASGRSASVTRELVTRTAEPVDLDANAQGNGVLDTRSTVVPGVRTDRPVTEGRRATLHGTLPRVDAAPVEVWFTVRWRPVRRWRSTTGQRRRSAESFSATVRLFRGLTYYVHTHARLPDGREYVGPRRRFRIPVLR